MAGPLTQTNPMVEQAAGGNASVQELLQNMMQQLTADVTMQFLLQRVLMMLSNILNYLKNCKKSGKRRIVVLNLLILLVFFLHLLKATKM